MRLALPIVLSALAVSPVAHAASVDVLESLAKALKVRAAELLAPAS